jgi:hypothetical protein
MTRLRKMFLLVVAAAAVGSCGSDSVPEERFRQSAEAQPTVTAFSVPDPDHFTFAMVGDTHIGNKGVAQLGTILDMAAAENDSFIIFLGDIVEDGSNVEDVQAYRNTLTSKGWDSKTATVIGNHDVFNDGWKNFLAYNGPSHYSFTAGNSKFIVLDTASGTVGSMQTDWLEGELMNLPKNTFLLSHYAPTVPTIRTYLKLSDPEEAVNLMKMAVTAGVRGWFGSHYHAYLHGKVNGIDIVIAGGGGGRLMTPTTQHFFLQVAVSGTDVTYKQNTFH